jgi:hypothetical protein
VDMDMDLDMDLEREVPILDAYGEPLILRW